MKIFYWNIRGVANIDSKNAFHNFCLPQKPVIVFISKPMTIVSSLPFNFWHACKMKFISGNDRGGLDINLWLCCVIDLDVMMVL